MYKAKPHQHQSLYHKGRGKKKKKNSSRTTGRVYEDRYPNAPLSAPLAPDVISHHRSGHREDKWLPCWEHGRVSEGVMKGSCGADQTEDGNVPPNIITDSDGVCDGPHVLRKSKWQNSVCAKIIEEQDCLHDVTKSTRSRIKKINRQTARKLQRLP